MIAIIGIVIVLLLAYIAWVVSGKRQEYRDRRDTKALHKAFKEAAEELDKNNN